ncbi:MAG: cytochrome c family protein [Ignavibacteriae bacterium]|nr:cytochrome c family protein [Ignavibacteriota bacterium]
MKKKIFITGLTLIIAVLVVFSSTSVSSKNAGSFKYVGVSKCQTCHKTDAQGKQFDIWQNSKHSQAWKTLQTEAADKIAKDKGFTTKAAETPQCIKCHVLGKDIVPDELAESFVKEDGVQCESCHGPGSEYKAMSVMKDKQKAIDNGLNVPSDKAQFCTGCHNPESPSYKEFKFDEMWEKIKHYKPKN